MTVVVVFSVSFSHSHVSFGGIFELSLISVVFQSEFLKFMFCGFFVL